MAVGGDWETEFLFEPDAVTYRNRAMGKQGNGNPGLLQESRTHKGYPIAWNPTDPDSVEGR